MSPLPSGPETSKFSWTDMDGVGRWRLWNGGWAGMAFPSQESPRGRNAPKNRLHVPCAHVSRSSRNHDVRMRATHTHLEKHHSAKCYTSSAFHSKRPILISTVWRSDITPARSTLRRPETRPISHERLLAKVEDIYARPQLLETKCIEQQALVAQERDPSKQEKLMNEIWQALIALPRTFLHERFDFFLAKLDTYRKALDPGGHRFVKDRCKIASSWFGLDIPSGKKLDDPASSEVTPGDKTCLPMVISGVTIDGRHDTGAESNFMTHKLATSLRLRIRINGQKPQSFTLANGKIMRTIGRVRARCTFAKEPGTRVKCWFHVCSALTTSLIMGSAFLAATKTLTQFKHRLQKRILGFGSIPTVNFIGTSMKAQCRFACRVNGRLTYVNADSASDLDLMSSYYVKANKLHIDRRRKVRKRIKLADQTQVETIGQVKAMIDLDDGSGKVYERVFDVLPGLTSEVLFGEDFLGLIDAFCSHESSFVMVPDNKRHSELNILENLGPVNNFMKSAIWGRRRPSRNPPASLAQQRDNLDMAENRRHDREMARIRKLPDQTARAEEEAIEKQRVAEYEQKRKDR